MGDDIQQVNMDNWHGSGNKFGLTFSQIVIQHINRCVLAASKEMIKGFWEVKRDKYGNELRSYNPDTRLEFINCVQALRHIMRPNFDDKIKQPLIELNKRIDDANERCLNAEDSWYEQLAMTQQKKIYYMKGFLNQDGIFFQQFINYKVDIYRLIFEELILLGKRLNFFEEEEIIEEL